jgi:hypothetical protein
MGIPERAALAVLRLLQREGIFQRGNSLLFAKEVFYRSAEHHVV